MKKNNNSKKVKRFAFNKIDILLGEPYWFFEKNGTFYMVDDEKFNYPSGVIESDCNWLIVSSAKNDTIEIKCLKEDILW